MAKFWAFVFLLLASMLLLFFAVQAFDIQILQEDTSYWLAQEKWVAGIAGVGLLIADVVAPVPSSIVMFANGILFGLFWGALLSIVGGLGAAWLGHWLGKKGEQRALRWMGEDTLAKTNRFFQKYGLLAIIVSRPIPLLAETLSITAGLSDMPRKKFLWGSFLGLLPAAILYAVAGYYAVEFDAGTYAFLGVMLLAALAWAIGQFLMRKPDPASVSD
jgi:uncharacterized membrane protein YdjX (TVP38/TMEM64 family)